MDKNLHNDLRFAYSLRLVLRRLQCTDQIINPQPIHTFAVSHHIPELEMPSALTKCYGVSWPFVFVWVFFLDILTVWFKGCDVCDVGL